MQTVVIPILILILCNLYGLLLANVLLQSSLQTTKANLYNAIIENFMSPLGKPSRVVFFKYFFNVDVKRHLKLDLCSHFFTF